ncbi:MAG TPA: hypothetical protein VMS31_03290 [Pyrinomonadaceae bacterium]|nr:hypothetical protein [Pyrinomonadaceae bacterium]
MSNRASGVTIVLGTLLIVAAAVAGILWLLYKLPATVVALVAGGVGFLATKLYESWKESRQRLHDKKRDVYAKLLAPFLALHLQILKGDGDRPAHKVVREKMTTQMVDATFDAVLYASDDVLKLWGRIRTAGLQNTDPTIVLVWYMRLLKAMRKDVGNSYTALSEADIMLLFVNFTDDDLIGFVELAAKTK